MNFVIQLQTTVVELNTYRDPQKKLKLKFLTLTIFNTVVTGFEAFLQVDLKKIEFHDTTSIIHHRMSHL